MALSLLARQSMSYAAQRGLHWIEERAMHQRHNDVESFEREGVDE
jgi:hypothetical protein